MSNTAKGMIAGLIATLVLSVLMLLNGSLDLIPTINVIQLLMSLGTLSAPSAWMDHFIVGVVVWGLLFAVYDSATTRPALWLKGIIFGMFAWLIMMVAFMPLAGAGFIGAKIGIMAVVGLVVRTPEVVNNASFIIIFPVTFVANTFVPSNTLPGPLKAFANWNPISAITQAARDLFGNTSSQLPPADTWSMQHPAAYSIIWVAIILAVFIPLAIRQFGRAASR